MRMSSAIRAVQAAFPGRTVYYDVGVSITRYTDERDSEPRITHRVTVFDLAGQDCTGFNGSSLEDCIDKARAALNPAPADDTYIEPEPQPAVPNFAEQAYAMGNMLNRLSAGGVL